LGKHEKNERKEENDFCICQSWCHQHDSLEVNYIMVLLQVVVPPGVLPGSQIQVILPNKNMAFVQVPPNSQPGSVITFSVEVNTPPHDQPRDQELGELVNGSFKPQIQASQPQMVHHGQLELSLSDHKRSTCCMSSGYLLCCLATTENLRSSPASILLAAAFFCPVFECLVTS
jgi:hypothetical protein